MPYDDDGQWHAHLATVGAKYGGFIGAGVGAFLTSELGPAAAAAGGAAGGVVGDAFGSAVGSGIGWVVDNSEALHNNMMHVLEDVNNSIVTKIISESNWTTP